MYAFIYLFIFKKKRKNTTEEKIQMYMLHSNQASNAFCLQM